MDFLAFMFVGFFHARHDSGLEGVAFFEQLVNTLRVGIFYVGQALEVA